MVYRILSCVLTAGLWSFGAAGVAPGKASTTIPLVVHYQGHISTGGAAFDGSGEFRFAIVDATTGVNLWTNDDSEVGTQNAPLAPLALPVSGGLYAVALGDTLLMSAIPASVFTNTDLALRVWFDDGTNGVQLLSPDQPVAAAPFAVLARQAQNAETLEGVPVGDLEESSEIDADIATHAAKAAVHHAKTVNASELSTGKLNDARLSANVTLLGPTIGLGGSEVTGQLPDAKIPDTIARDTEIDADIATHAANATVHHTKTVDASELSAGTLNDALLSANVTLLGPTIALGGSEVTGQLPDAKIPGTIARDTEIDTAVDAHNASASAHPNFNADTVDGQHASDFMPVATDYWVNTTGDTMSGTSALNILTVSNGGEGNAIYGQALGTAGTGVKAEASGGRAVQGKALSTTSNTNYGGYFLAAGKTGQAVYGAATNEVAGNYGGYFLAAGPTGTGVRGEATNTTGHNVGGAFFARGDTGSGVWGYASGDNGIAILGETNGVNGKGVKGFTSGAGNTVSGDFVASGTGNAVAVQGYASNTGDVTNHGGYFTAAGLTARGVYARASNTGGGRNYGGFFTAAGRIGEAVHGEATNTVGSNVGGSFSAAGATGIGVNAEATGTWGAGIKAIATGSSGTAVYGEASDASDTNNVGGSFTAAGITGIGVRGTASNSAGTNNFGGYFTAAGARGRAVYGSASNTTGINYGGEFYAYGASGVGVMGYATGVNGYGIRGDTSGTNAVAGDFFSSGASARGVKSRTTGTNGIAGDFTADGTGNAVAVQGYASGTGAVTNHGGYFTAAGTTSRGVYASGKQWDFYAGGTGANYGPFTGGHEVKLAAGFPAQAAYGLITSVTGETQVRTKDSGEVSLSSTMPTVRLADTPNDKAVFGVLMGEAPLAGDHWYQPAAGERFATVNALGEGRVWVCNANGNTEVGDYVTTSAVPGYGQLQDDDLLHNYTLGKVTESVDWDTVQETVSFGGNEYKVYLTAVVYTSG